MSSWKRWQELKAEAYARATLWRREEAEKLIEERKRRGAAAARQVHTLEDGGASPSAASIFGDDA